MKDFLKRNRNPHDLAERFDITLSKARRVVHREESEILGWGRSSMQRYIVSRRANNMPEWPREHRERLRHYQNLHDQGRVTMCQGRDGRFTIQYAIPMKKQIQRAPYFTARDVC